VVAIAAVVGADAGLVRTLHHAATTRRAGILGRLVVPLPLAFALTLALAFTLHATWRRVPLSLHSGRMGIVGMGLALALRQFRRGDVGRSEASRHRGEHTSRQEPEQRAPRAGSIAYRSGQGVKRIVVHDLGLLAG
jgi:hypothetical protein